MRNLWLFGVTLLVFASLASAQVPTSGNVYFGYSYYSADLSGRSSLNGWNGSLEGKILPWVGVVADFSGAYGSDANVCPVIPNCSASTASAHEHNVLFGPRLSVSLGKIRPFAEVMVGAGRISTSGTLDTSFATAIGGGIDYKIIRPLAWRFEGDYLQTRFFGTTQNNIRLSTGIVLRF
jgi:hypothetical protein